MESALSVCVVVFLVCLVGFIVAGWAALYTSGTCCADSSTNGSIFIVTHRGSAIDPEFLIILAGHHHIKLGTLTDRADLSSESLSRNVSAHPSAFGGPSQRCPLRAFHTTIQSTPLCTTALSTQSRWVRTCENETETAKRMKKPCTND